jgi:hypothetical protein
MEDPRNNFRLRCGRAGSWKSTSASACDQAPHEKSHAMVRLVGRVIGVGIETADMLVREVLSRNLRDRRAAARYAGLTGAPDESGSKRRDKGLARAGDARVRRGMIQLAWRFLMFQKERALAQWPPRDGASGCAKAASCRAEVRPRLRRRNALASARRRSWTCQPRACSRSSRHPRRSAIRSAPDTFLRRVAVFDQSAEPR